jgi:hypothetical protein
LADEQARKPHNFNAITRVPPPPALPLIALRDLQADRNPLVSSLSATPLDDSGRMFRFYSTLEGDKRLYLQRLEGREAVSEPFEFR